MATYMTRIELHKKDNKTVSAEDYETLHTEMRKKGFKTTIKGVTGKTYHLLTAEYQISTENDLEKVLNDAGEAANNTKKASQNIENYSVFSCDYSSAMWTNLKEVK
ncbi:hypothetical protein ACI6Q2_13560 [Chitinophagaceae bacterium LWZ2-11]